MYISHVKIGDHTHVSFCALYGKAVEVLMGVEPMIL